MPCCKQTIACVQLQCDVNCSNQARRKFLCAGTRRELLTSAKGYSMHPHWLHESLFRSWQCDTTGTHTPEMQSSTS